MDIRFFGWTQYIKILKDGNIITQISKKIDCSYSHAVGLTNLLEKNKIIITKKKGRAKHLYLTLKGQKIQECLLIINQLIKEN